MAKVVLHMGTHKTATTTVQDTLHANRPLLERHGVIYPDLGRHTGHHGLLTDWVPLAPAYHLPGGGTATLAEIADRHRATDRTLFLSSEEFLRAGPGAGLVDMAALARIFDGYSDIRVIVLLREQWQFLQSVYLEIARTRAPDAPAQMIEAALATGKIDGLWCDYQAIHAHLRTGFAPHQIRIVDYDRIRQAPGGIIGQFLRLLGLQSLEPELETVNRGRSNASLAPIPTWAAHLLLGGGHAGPEVLATALDAFGREYGPDAPSCLLTRAEIERLCAHFGPGNSRLAAALARVQPGFHIGSSRPPAGTIYREDIGAAFWMRLARRLWYRPIEAA